MEGSGIWLHILNQMEVYILVESKIVNKLMSSAVFLNREPLRKGDPFDINTEFRRNDGTWVRLKKKVVENIRKGPNKHRTYNPGIHKQCRKILKRKEE